MQADQFNLRNRSQFIIPNVKNVNHSSESLKYLGHKIWDTVPSHLKVVDSLKKLKNTIKNGNQTCPCRLCKIYIGNIGYIYVCICEKKITHFPNNVQQIRNVMVILP